MQALKNLEQQEAKEDIFFGQVVIIWARWFLIMAGAVLILPKVQNPAELLLGVVPIAVLMAMNFFLHGRYMVEKPVGSGLIVLTSLMDLVIITLLVIFFPVEPGSNAVRASWPGGQHGPLYSQLFVFYYPMVLAFGLVVPRKVEIAYTVLAIAVYSAMCLLSLFANDIIDYVQVGDVRQAVAPFSVEFQNELKGVILRGLTLAAMGGLGNYYFRIMRRRRHAALGDTAQ